MPSQRAERCYLPCGTFKTRGKELKTPASGTEPTVRILIVDDDAGQRSLLDSFLRSQGFQTTVVESGERALEMLRDGNIAMMISDVRMPGLTGLETLRRARQINATLPVLLVTAYADIREAVGAMRDGAVNYLAKPIDLDELLASVQQATGISKSTPLRYDEDRQLPAHVVANSPLMQAVFRDVSLVAPSETRVLITGESGVGKEVLADVIHAWSTRAPARWSRSIAPPSPKRCWKANCSGTKAARSPARTPSASAVLRKRTTARFFSMKSPRCPRSSRPSCCA